VLLLLYLLTSFKDPARIQDDILTMPVRITTWNVNGIRNPFSYQPWRDNRSFTAMFDILEADIVIMQELKIQRKDLQDDMVLVPGWDCYFSLPKHKKGTFHVTHKEARIDIG